MKIATRIAVCFFLIAVVPLGAASAVFLYSTANFGRDMADRGKELMAERLVRDLRRATEHAAVAFAGNSDTAIRAAMFLAADIAARLGGSDVVPSNVDTPLPFVFPDALPNGGIDLERLSVRIVEDARKDLVADTLTRIAGFEEVARTVYLRNRALLRGISVVLEEGVTLTYPAGAARKVGDPREDEWYLRTLETQQSDWHGDMSVGTDVLGVTAPVQMPDGQLAGAVRLNIRLAGLLEETLAPTMLPPEAQAYLIVVPNEDPRLMPHEAAMLGGGEAGWRVDEAAVPLFPDGDAAWLKVISDLRSGVPGVETVRRAGTAEVWSFGPIGRTTDGAVHIAVVLPDAVIEAARLQVEGVVRNAFRDQALKAAVFALIAAILAVLLGLAASRTLTRPIHALHDAAARLGEGDFSVRIQNPGGDELGDLGRDFNRMVPALEEQFRIKRDLAVAREIQQHLMPQAAPRIAGFDVAGCTVYCDETGGDYQDYIPLQDDRLAVVIGDVTGHGVGAALLMATARSAFRAQALHAHDPATLLNTVNGQLVADNAQGRFLTLFFAELRPEARDITWISAGHEPALLFDPDTDRFCPLRTEGIPLGIDGDWVYTVSKATLPAQGLLIAYTDGIREASNGSGEHYGVERLKAAVRGMTGRGSRAICDHVLADVARFRGDASAKDDMSILVIRPD